MTISNSIEFRNIQLKTSHLEEHLDIFLSRLLLIIKLFDTVFYLELQYIFLRMQIPFLYITNVSFTANFSNLV